MITLIIMLILILTIFYIIFIYNRLIRLQNLTKEGWSGIEIQLKLRSNLIPNLVETVKGYMGHENNVLTQITELRSQCLTSPSVTERAQSENQLTQAIRQLFAVAENYPDLKASQNFIELQKSLSAIEDQIQLARRYYNGAARDFNITLQSFPSNLIANHFHFKSYDYFEIEDLKERELPQVKFS